MTSYPNIWRVVILCHILILIMHWFACFYYMISESEGFYVPEGVYKKKIITCLVERFIFFSLPLNICKIKRSYSRRTHDVWVYSWCMYSYHFSLLIIYIHDFKFFLLYLRFTSFAGLYIASNICIVNIYNIDRLTPRSQYT